VSPAGASCPCPHCDEKDRRIEELLALARAWEALAHADPAAARALDAVAAARKAGGV